MAEPTTNGQVEVDYEALPIGLGLGVNMAAGALVSTSAVLNYPSLSPFMKRKLIVAHDMRYLFMTRPHLISTTQLLLHF